MVFWKFIAPVWLTPEIPNIDFHHGLRFYFLELIPLFLGGMIGVYHFHQFVVSVHSFVDDFGGNIHIFGKSRVILFY
jgi:hypothetical protein